MGPLSISVLGLCSTLTTASIVGQKPLTSDVANVYDFKGIASSKTLEWTPCFDEYQCARLDVPQDWSETPSTDARASIAIAKLPAKVNVTDPRYAGPVLLNPGMYLVYRKCRSSR